jgi:hypothetical protein
MSIVKISQLPETTSLNSNTANTLFVAVDLLTGGTYKMTARTLAQGLFDREILAVGTNPIIYSNVIGQFASSSNTFLQINLQNFNSNGSSDYVASTSDSNNANNFVDMGINGKTFGDPVYTAMKPYDAYLFNLGPSQTSTSGNLVIGTGSTSDIVLIAGGTLSSNIIGRIGKNSYNFYKPLNVTGNTTVSGNTTVTGNVVISGTSNGIVFSDGTTQTTNSATYAYTTSVISNLQGVNLSQNTNIQAVFDKANLDITSVAASSGTYGNSSYVPVTTIAANGRVMTIVNTAISIPISQVIGLQDQQDSQNSSISFVQGGLNSANANITYIFAVNATQNTSISAANTLAQNAYNKANNAIANTNGVTTAGNFNISGNLNVLSVEVDGLFTVNATAQVANTAAFTIIGSNNYITQTPLNQGYMVHITGYANTPTRIVADSYGANTYPAYIGRAARGSSSAPAATQNNDILMRITGNGWGSTEFSNLGVARIDVVATQNYTDTAKGSRIDLWNTRSNSNTLVKIASFNSDSVEFTGSVTPQKGFIWIPRNTTLNTPTVAIDFANDSVVRVNTNVNLTASLSSFVAGKVVEMWVTNTHTGNRTFTHGCAALNSTVNDIDYTIPATSTIFVRYLSFSADLSNTFVAITHT